MYFPTTHWSVLAKATLNGELEARTALDEMCRRYWSPLNQFIRARGYPPAEAADITQTFLVYLMEHSVFRKADAKRGRFRSFLLGALANFLNDHRDRQHAAKRGGLTIHEPLETLGENEPASQLDDAEIARFDRAWAVNILRTTLARVQQEFEAAGRGSVFLVARNFLPGAGNAPAYDTAARQLGMTMAAFTSELHRLRQRVRFLIREEVMSTLSAPHEIGEEMAHLQRVLMDRGTQFLPADES